MSITTNNIYNAPNFVFDSYKSYQEFLDEHGSDVLNDTIYTINEQQVQFLNFGEVSLDSLPVALGDKDIVNYNSIDNKSNVLPIAVLNNGSDNIVCYPIAYNEFCSLEDQDHTINRIYYSTSDKKWYFDQTTPISNENVVTLISDVLNIVDADIIDSLIMETITECSNSRVTSIGNYAFYNCFSLTTIDFPNATSIGNYAFYKCYNLITVDFPNATSIESFAFYNCYNLITVDFPNVTNIGSSAFYSCTKLTALILRNTEQVCTLLNTNVFTNTPIRSGLGYIYVPSTLVDSYKTATNWTTYADYIRAIEDYPDICGGTTEE